MNLIQQLQTTPKWKEFEKWYRIQPEFTAPYLINEVELDRGNLYAFKNFPFMLQKGVFEKFIESQGFIIEQWYKISVKQMYVCLFNDAQKESIFEGTFEELLIWYFNN